MKTVKSRRRYDELEGSRDRATPREGFLVKDFIWKRKQIATGLVREKGQGRCASFEGQKQGWGKGRDLKGVPTEHSRSCQDAKDGFPRN